MTIWADADSLPREARELIARRCKPGGPAAVFVANRPVPLPPGPSLTALVVGAADGAADGYIMDNARRGDLVVTRDIPLAARLVDAGIVAINDRGDIWNDGTVRERLSARDHAAALRDAGLAPPLSRGRTYGQKERAAFAAALDKALRLAASQGSPAG